MNIDEQKRWLLVFGLFTLMLTGILIGPALRAEWEYRTSDERAVRCQAAKAASDAWTALDQTARAAEWEVSATRDCWSAAQSAGEIVRDQSAKESHP